MKKIIKKWLGLHNLEDMVLNLMNQPEPKMPEKSWQQEEELRNSRITLQLVVQILDYLGLDYRKDLVPDPSRLREPEPMRESYTIVKRKKK